MARVGNWGTGTGATLLPLQARGPLTQATIASLSTLTTAGVFENHTVLGVANADPVTLVGTTFAGIPPTAIAVLGSLFSGTTNQIALGTAAGSAAVKFLIANISNFNTPVATTVPFNIALTTPQVLFLANSIVTNQVNIFGWVDSVNAN